MTARMDSYQATHIDDISAEQWPYWAPIRHHFRITTFGINAWRGGQGDEVIKRHHESESGAPELYLVLSGHATFTVGGKEVEAPAGMLVFVRDPTVERLAVANETNTVVLSIGAAAEGKAFEAVGWDSSYLEG
jgi:mannose-6-phosphate isomerase-like protein (cupin superfamily)